MKTYDTFNPTIPDADETAVCDTLPPVTEDIAQPKPKQKEQKERVNKVKKPAAAKPKTQSVPFFIKIKNWATSQTLRWLIGLFLGFFAVYLGVAFLSFELH